MPDKFYDVAFKIGGDAQKEERDDGKLSRYLAREAAKHQDNLKGRAGMRRRRTGKWALQR